jgi:hypothetical protein
MQFPVAALCMTRLPPGSTAAGGLVSATLGTAARLGAIEADAVGKAETEADAENGSVELRARDVVAPKGAGPVLLWRAVGVGPRATDRLPSPLLPCQFRTERRVAVRMATTAVTASTSHPILARPGFAAGAKFAAGGDGRALASPGPGNCGLSCAPG